jgi:hypothetical protein
MDFLKALELGLSNETIVFGGELYEVPRQRLRGHYALEATMSELKERMDTGLYDTVDCYLEWMAYATGFSEEWLDQQDPIEFADAFLTLAELNEPKFTLPWMTVRTKSPKTNADYPNRGLASIVHRLAGAYHWTEEEVFSLVPEVAWCYLQEIQLSEHHREEFQYGLSDVAYDKKGQYKDYQKLPWQRTLGGGDSNIPDFLRREMEMDCEWVIYLQTLRGRFVERGGPGSGHWGHKGRKGKRGGSASSGAKGLAKEPGKGAEGSIGGKPFEYYTLPNGERYEIGPEEAAEILGLPDRDVGSDAHISKVEWEWVSGGAEDPGPLKQEIADWYKSNPGVKEMRLLGQYNMEGKAGQSFEEWKNTPMPLWRGGRPEFGETFSSFSHNKRTAEGFARRRGVPLYRADVRPNDWVGITRGAESEVFIPEFDSSWNPIRYKPVE